MTQFVNDKLLHFNDFCRHTDTSQIHRFDNRINSKLEFFNSSGERIWEPLHNKTVIAGAAMELQKLFNLDRKCLENTPTYDEAMQLDDAAPASAYPTVGINDRDGNLIGSIADESQRVILGFCVGAAGAGLESSDVFEVPYASWITPDTMVPFRYPLEASDKVDESIYKGKKTITLSNGQIRAAYYFKEFSNSTELVQNYVSTIGTFSDTISARNVYSETASADKAQSYIELHLKITKDDCREFFIAHTGLEQAKINQISLVYGWKKNANRVKMNSSGIITNSVIEVYQQVRPYSICNFPTEILSDRDKTVSIIYTLYA